MDLMKRIEKFQLLNSDQREIVVTILENVIYETHRTFFIDGPAGTGKTFVYDVLYSMFSVLGFKVQCVCHTASAASLLPQARTAHSFFRIPLNMKPNQFLHDNIPLMNDFPEIDILIWDEISTVSIDAVEFASKVLSVNYECDQLFAGKYVIFGGDFRQSMPIVKEKSVENAISKSVLNWPEFRNFRKLQLRQNERIKDKKFAAWLLDVGDGKINEVCFEHDLVSTNLLRDVYGQNVSSLRPDELSRRVILCSKNIDVNRVNDEALSQLPGKLYELFSNDWKTKLASNELSDEETSKMQPTRSLKLKIGAMVILTRNILIREGLVNGARFIVKEIHRNFIRVLSITNFNMYDINRYTYERKTKRNRVSRSQFPLILGYAMTIHRSQGHTFDFVGLYLSSPKDIFTHGQLYVALSRCRSMENLRVNIPVIRNVVYKEMLENNM